MTLFNLFSVLALFAISAEIVNCQSQATFENPIIFFNSADPFVMRVGSDYYLLVSTLGESRLTIFKSRELTNFRNADRKDVFFSPAGFANVWAAEMHYMPDGNLYMYFAMNRDGDSHRQYVMKADDPQNPMGNWGPIQRLMPNLEVHVVDGTPMIPPGGDKFFYVWPQQDHLYIAEMIDPVTISNQTVLLRSPTRDWERNVNEGPFLIYNQNVSYLVFSASFTFSAHYCLGLMSVADNLDPLVTDNWWYGEDGPVFWRNDEEDVYGPGHASFTTSPDGTETWVIYHASDDPVRIEGNRIARADKITWGPDGKPIFPRPHGFSHPQPVPSGQM